MNSKKYSIAILIIILIGACSKLPYDENPPLFEPSDLVYSDNPVSVSEYEPFSTTPNVIGTGPLAFSLVDNYEYFEIDTANGRISLPKDHLLSSGSYSLSVLVKNDIVSSPVLFENILDVEITPFDASSYIPSNLIYESGLVWQSGKHSISSVPTLDGESPFTFALDEETVEDFFINEENGRIYVEEDNNLLEGVYKLSVKINNKFTNDSGVLFSEVFEIKITEEEVLDDVNLLVNEFCDFESFPLGDLNSDGINYWDMTAWNVTPQIVNDASNATNKALYIAGEKTFQAFWNRNDPLQLEAGKTYELSVYMKGIKDDGANVIKVAMHFWNLEENKTAKVEQKELTPNYQKYSIQWTCNTTGDYIVRFNTLSVQEGCMSQFWFDEIFVKEL